MNLSLMVEMLQNTDRLSDDEARQLELIQLKENYTENKTLIIELYDKYFMFGVEQ